jgi:hypothetical protein
MNKPPNELEQDDAWQRSVFDPLLRPVLKEHAHDGQIVFLDLITNQFAALVQKRAHLDIVAQLPNNATMSIEVKIVRWPGAKEGRPGYTHWKDFFLEMWSSKIQGHEQAGWMTTSQADILLFCQCAQFEDFLDCFPLPFKRLRAWVNEHLPTLEVRHVPNPISGRLLWTEGVLAPITKICRDLKVDGFRVNKQGLITDLFGKPVLGFLTDG